MERRSIAITGTVQGVGFRPFVYNLASSLRLSGFVRNQVGGVQIEVEGEAQALDRFVDQVIGKPPPLARIDQWACEPSPLLGEIGFHIDPSDQLSSGAVVIPADAATCVDCLRELFDPFDRRYRYPFLNCTNCGPRLTVITGAPYDRNRTTMAGFTMCRQCRAEYEDPANRRFHAQPNACAICGPKLSLLDADGRETVDADPLAAFVAAIRAGKIGALKGLGGFHLVCDATDRQAVARLRERKHREEKPFAVMVQDIESARLLCEIGPQSADLLTSVSAPIVLCPKRRGIALGGIELAAGVAPGNPTLGVMLPTTPLHHLLLHDVHGVPLIMTSGNRSDEPIAIDTADAVERLAGIADVFLVHDRPIHVRCDDSVTRVVGQMELPIRRSRGYAPQPMPVSFECSEPILATGGQLKGTFALGSGRRAVLSHHMGDLDHFEAFRAFERDVALYEELFALRPRVIAHDLHPDYASTGYALRRQAREGVRCVAVQHHHAHMASCMAENRLDEPVIGVTLDGTGYGTDGAIWGGEFLIGDYRSFRRAAQLRYVPMPGGDKAVREPWRMALSHLADAGAHCARFESRHAFQAMANLRRMIERRLNSPMTSSAGRLFDAVAALIGLRQKTTYEGQAAMELEWLARGEVSSTAYPFEFDLNGSANDRAATIIDTRPLIAAIAGDVDAGVAPVDISRRFHATWIELISRMCHQWHRATGLTAVVLSGGVFMNALLSTHVSERLTREGLRVFRHSKVPCNDGGLALGQLAVAASQPRPS
jgi:hydrogenase maturation protein HypF